MTAVLAKAIQELRSMIEALEAEVAALRDNMARTQVQSELLAVNSISGTIIADNAITATHIATNAISGTLVQDGGIVTVMIAANNVTATKIVTDAVQTRHIADDQVTEAKLANAINTSIAAKLPLSRVVR